MCAHAGTFSQDAEESSGLMTAVTEKAKIPKLVSKVDLLEEISA